MSYICHILQKYIIWSYTLYTMSKRSVDHITPEEMLDATRVAVDLDSGIRYCIDQHQLLPTDGGQHAQACLGRLTIEAAHSLGRRRDFEPIVVVGDITVGEEFYCEPFVDALRPPLNRHEQNVLFELQHGHLRNVKNITAYKESQHATLRQLAKHKYEVFAGVAGAGVLLGSLVVRHAIKHK